jgi:caffeoyl-CoA O-methyltransferase
MDLINPIASNYVEKFSAPLDELLTGVLERTQAEHPHAHMISGHVQGILLEFLCRMLRPQNVLEIGSFTGFSALCMAKGMGGQGRLDTIEIRKEDAATAQENFNRSPYSDQISLHIGDAHTIIPGLAGPWDMVFIDADKVSYIEYYELTLPYMRPGGFLVADNVLFHGEVLEEVVKGKNALAIHAFNQHVASDNRVDQLMLTVRDGLMLIRKK